MGCYGDEMVKQAFLFAGQGAQFVGMGKDLYEKFPVCKEVYDKADEILGFSISKLSFEGPEDELTKTKISQPAIFTMSAAIMALIKSEFPDLKPSYVCGLSLGEYNALVAANVLSFEDGLRLVQKRGALMDEAASKHSGAMASIIRLDLEVLKCVVEEAGCEIANLNSREQTVISGTAESVEKACELAKEKGAKRAIPLKVSGAFHSRLMKEAGEGLSETLESFTLSAPEIDFYANVTAEKETDPLVIKELLGQQVSQPVRWFETIEALQNEGVSQAIEIGPGTVLKGLARKIDPELVVENLGSVTDVEMFTAKS